MKPPILRDFPDSFETERLVLRAPRPGDGEALREAVTESLAELRPWLGWVQGPPTPSETETMVRQSHVAWLDRSDLKFHLRLEQGGALVGCASLHGMDWAVPRFEIGYWCRTSMLGRGYATEAVRGLVDFAFRELDAHRVEIHCDPRNVRSVRVAERAGFELEGELRNHEVTPDGSIRDTLVFALVSDGA